MQLWLIVCVLLCASASEQCSEVSADVEAESPVIGGLDSALETSASRSSAFLCLALSSVSFSVNTLARVTSRVTIQGNAQTIAFFETVEVRGFLAILNSTLTVSVYSADFSMFSVAGGFLHIKDSVVRSASAAVVAGSGAVVLEHLTFRNSVGAAISIDNREDSTVEILQCEVFNHTGEFLRVVPLHSGSLFVSISQTTFRGNGGSGYLLTVSAPLLTGTFAISEAEFTSNDIPLLYFDIGDFQAQIVRSSFTNNSQSTLILLAKGSVFELEDSLWSGNSQIVFDIWQFTGDFVASGITVTNQVWKGVFQLSNSQPPEECRFTVQESSFLDTYFKVNEPTPGLIGANGCTMLITHTLISNMRMATMDPRHLEGLVMLKFGSLVISHLTLRSSGTVGVGLGVGMGDFAITDSFLYDIRSGLNIYVGITLGSFVVRDVNITNGAGFLFDGNTIGSAPMYFTSMMSYMEVRNARVLPGPMLQGYNPNAIFAAFSTLNITGMVIQHIPLIDAIGNIIDCGGSISDVTIDNTVLGFAVFYLYSFDFMRIANVTISDSSIRLQKSTGIFFASPGLNIECTDFSLNNVTVDYFVASKKSTVRMVNINITNSHLGSLLMYQVDSSVYLENVTVQKSTTAVAFLYRSSLFLVNSLFEDITSNSVIFQGDEVNMTLDRVIIKNASSPLGFSVFKERSQLAITQSVFDKFESPADEGFHHDTGTLTITESSFRHFNTIFIRASSCSVFITDSVFQEGKGKALSRISDSAYGGALGCVDCTSVIVQHSSFLNVSAVFGGAIAVRSSNGFDSQMIRISHSEFVRCSASTGGALYLSQSSFLIDGSQFVGNDAESTGGAIDISTSQEQDALIRNCEFYRNSAREGGAVKWKDAEVTFINATFQDNSALYGPDIASYGVKLAGSITSSNGTLVSGHPLQLIFEFQDHYGQTVTTASTQEFQLVSSDQVSFRGNTAASIAQGIFNFSELIIYAQPGSKQTIVGVMVTSHIREVLTIRSAVDIAFRDCVPGEVRKSDRCEYCFTGNVSFSPSDSDCRFCPKHGFCTGGNGLLVDRHYWRSGSNSTTLVRCPLRENCLGGENSECAVGYTGQVCNECSEDYTRLRTLECERCGNAIVQWGKVLLIAAPIIGFHLVVKVATTIQLFVFKTIINHAQLLSTLAYLRVPFPPVIKYSLHSLSYISSLLTTDLPISCISSVESEYAKAVIGSALPLLLSVLFALLNCRNKKKARIVCTSAMMFTPIISLGTQLPLLACQSVLSEEEFLFVDMQQTCWKGRHLLLIRALLVPSVILNVIFPMALVAVISTVSPKKFGDSFPLWVSGVNLRSWDLLLYCAKCALMCLVILSVVIEQLCQVTFGLLVLIIVSVVVSGMSNYAYTHWKWFALTESSLVIVAVSMGLCSYFIYRSPSNGAIEWLITALFVAANIGFFAMCVKVWRVQAGHAIEGISQSPLQGNPVPQNSLVELEGS